MCGFWTHSLHCMWKFLGQGSGPHCYNDNTRSLTYCTTRKLWTQSFESKGRDWGWEWHCIDLLRTNNNFWQQSSLILLREKNKSSSSLGARNVQSVPSLHHYTEHWTRNLIWWHLFSNIWGGDYFLLGWRLVFMCENKGFYLDVFIQQSLFLR